MKTAFWVLDSGAGRWGAIRYHGQNGLEPDVRYRQNLPPKLKLQGVVLASVDLPDGALSRLAKLDDLQALDLSEHTLSQEDFEDIAKITTLHWLYLAGAKFDETHLSTLGSLEQLESLSMSRTPLTHAGLAALPRLPKLVRLELMDLELTDASLVELSRQCPQLMELDLTNSSITSSGLDELKNLPALRMLCLAGNPISVEAIDQLAGLSQLSHLDIVGAAMSKSDVKHLQELLPDCEILFDDVERSVALAVIRDGGTVHAADTNDPPAVQSAQLPTVVFEIGKIVTEDLQADVAIELPNLSALQILDARCKGLTAEGVEAIGFVKTLQSLSLERAPDVSTLRLRGLPELTKLSLADSALDDKQLASFRSQSIRTLSLARTKITDGAIDSLRNFPSLFTLNLAETKVTPAGVLRISRSAPQLAELTVDAQIADAIRQQLRRTMPNCAVQP